MSDHEIKQEGNVVLGDQSAGDMFKFSITKSQRSLASMKRLLKKFEEQVASNTTLSEYVEELKSYATQKEGDIIGLEEKLKGGPAEHFTEYALEAKESYHKKLTRYQLFEAAQQIHIHLLALTKDRFEYHIKPLLRGGIAEQQLALSLRELVIEPIREELDENPLDLNAVDVTGMLYFLTGNCHLRWNVQES